jgi:hypothetical protein
MFLYFLCVLCGSVVKSFDMLSFSEKKMSDDDGKVREVPFAERARALRELQTEIAAVNWLIAHLATNLPPDSPTALAIKRGASWQQTRSLARWEDAGEIAALLEDAFETLGADLPPESPSVLDSDEQASRLEANLIPLPFGGSPRHRSEGENELPPGDKT